jgi:hypothetical protein
VVVFDVVGRTSLDGMVGHNADLDRLAQGHCLPNHHPRNFATSGTARLTGTPPWTHRALSMNGQVADWLSDHNIFDAFRDYHRASYT